MDATSRSAWRNRIVGEGEMPASQFTAHPQNWRRHSTEQQAVLEAILDRVGWIQRVLVSQRSGYVVDGHLRVMSALKRGDQTPIPYATVDLDPDEEALVLATYDPIAALAETDRAQLGDLLAGIRAEDAAIANLLKDLALEATPPSQEVHFTVEDRPTCPTCGQKLRQQKGPKE